jgi:alkylation response protein AidB-like acyl-CoA dehydrogenase
VRLCSNALLAANADEMIARLVEGAIIALSAEAVGAMGALLEMTVNYAATRKQFGVPIGGFQVIAHRLADMKLAFVKVRSTLLYTTALAESDRAAPRDFSLLKAQVGRLGRSLAESAVQIHGGVGVTDELAVGHYLKRILAVDAMFGASDYHLRVVGSTTPEG